MLASEQKQQIVRDFATKEGDTGSSEVQVAVLTERIRQLTEHLKRHRHDYHAQRGLLMMVGQRRRQLTYLHHRDATRYQALITRLGLRR